MTSSQLNLFLVVAKHLNFSAAAKELYMTQPAVSHQIVALEKELGTKLFQRSTRKIQLTHSGELFLEDAKRILDLEDAAKERILLSKSSGDLSLSICYLLDPCHSFLPKLCVKMQEQFPQVKIQLQRMDARNLDTSMDQNLYDMYFSLSRDLGNHPEYAKKDILDDTLCLICPENHPCSRLTKIDYNKLSSERVFMMDPENALFMHRQILQLCRSINFVPQRISYCSSLEEVLFQVESGLGVAILPMRSCSHTAHSISYIPLSGNSSQMKLGVAWLLNSDNPAIEWMLEILEQSQQEHPEWFR